MSRKKRAEREKAKEQRTLEDLKAHKNLSKYQRKEMARKGVDMAQFNPEQEAA